MSDIAIDVINAGINISSGNPASAAIGYAMIFTCFLYPGRVLSINLEAKACCKAEDTEPDSSFHYYFQKRGQSKTFLDKVFSVLSTITKQLQTSCAFHVGNIFSSYISILRSSTSD